MEEVALFTTSALRWLLLAAAAPASAALNHSALRGWGACMGEVASHARFMRLTGAADGGCGPRAVSVGGCLLPFASKEKLQLLP